MSSVPAGKRSWKCPECGDEVLLSMTQLDPIACEACVVKMKGGNKAPAGSNVAAAAAGPLVMWQGLPETTKLAFAAGCLVVGLLIGLAIGFFAGKASAPSAPSASTHRSSPHVEAEDEERPEAPGPGYKWVRGRERKDGTRGPGHWAKDPLYKGDNATSSKKKKD